MTNPDLSGVFFLVRGLYKMEKRSISQGWGLNELGNDVVIYKSEILVQGRNFGSTGKGLVKSSLFQGILSV